MARPIRGAASAEAEEKSNDVIKAPAICPESRVVPCMPPAAPLRSIGAVRNMLRLFATLKRPNPRPHSMVKTMSGASVLSIGQIAARPSPVVSPIPPSAQSNVLGPRSAIGAAAWDANATANGHGVM